MNYIKNTNILRIIMLFMVIGFVLFSLTSGVTASQSGASNDFNPELNKALDWMEKNQDSEGRWIGRLSPSNGGTSLAIISLIKAGEKSESKYIHDGVAWLINNQNADGGWGERKGSSSMRHTGLTVAALRASGLPYNSSIIQKGIDYINLNGGFSATGVFAATMLAEEGIISHDQIPHSIITVEDIDNKSKFDYIASPDIRLLFFGFALIGELQDTDHTQSEEEAIEKTINWLKSSQFSDGSWHDVSATYVSTIALIKSGESVDSTMIQKAVAWIKEVQQQDGGYPNIKDLRVTDTGLVLQALSELDNTNKLSSEADKSIEWFSRLQNPNGGWGWIEEKPSDIDDTAIVLLALTKTGVNPNKEEIQNGIRYLRERQDKNGGWTTYGGGYLDPTTPDVTARIMLAFTDAGISADDPALINASEYLLSQQRTDGTWNGFWGIGPIYGSAYPIQSLLRVGIPATDTSIQMGINWLINNQNSDGGWGIPYEGQENSGSTTEETSLAVYTLLTAGIFPESQTIQNGLKWLSANQYEDGSWPAADIFLYASQEKYYDTAFPNAMALSALGKYQQLTEKTKH